MAIWNKIAAFINKDVSDENEAKGTAVIMRVFILSMLFYFILQIILFVTYREIPLILYMSVMILLYAIVFFCTYKFKTAVCFWIVQILTLCWIIFSVLLTGWEFGIPHFLFVLLALSLVGGYHRIYVKASMAAAYCTIRLVLYFYMMNAGAYCSLSRIEGMIFQVTNTLVVYLQMTLLIVTFSKEIQATERKLVKYNKKIVELASRDPLTKLYNRRAMIDKMNDMVAMNQNYFCIAIADIDFFKKVNDTYGHEAGDEVLKKVADTLSAFMEGKGYVARWGGEEFLFLYQNGNGDEVKMEFDKLRRQIGKMTIPYKDLELIVHMTFGIQEYDCKKPLDASISKADEKLYRGKMSGRDKVIF